MIKHDVKVYFDSRLMDFKDPSQSLMGSILSSINTYQAKLQSYQTKKVLQKNASEGKAHGVLPYGYCRDINGLMIIDEEEAEIVKRIYTMSLNGIGTNKIAQTLSDEGVPTRYNKMERGGTLTTKNKYTKKETTKRKSDIKWSGKTVGNIIKGTLYYGERIFSGREHKCPAIFEKKYWKKVNDNLTKNRNNSGKKVNHKYMLKGVIECGGCGRNMYGRTRTSSHDNYYMCSGRRYKECDCDTRSINIAILERFIWSRFFEKQELLKALKEYFNRDSTAIKKIDSNSNFQNSRIMSLTKEKEKAVELVVKGILSENEIISVKNRINNDIEEARGIIFDLKEQKKAFSQSNEMLAQLKTLSNNLKPEKPLTPKEQMAKHLNRHLPKEQSLKGISFQDKSTIIKKYIKRIKINSDDDLKLYNIAISFTINIEPQNFVMNYFKRVPYINSLESIKVLPKSQDWKDRYQDKHVFRYLC